MSGGIMSTGARADDSPKEIFEKIAPSTVQVIVAGQTALRVRIGDGEPVPVRVVGDDPCEDLAAVNPGNPGGPLLNSDAELVGINT